MHSADFLKNVSTRLLVDESDIPDIHFVEGGYLFLASEKGKETLTGNYNIQRYARSACINLFQEKGIGKSHNLYFCLHIIIVNLLELIMQLVFQLI